MAIPAANRIELNTRPYFEGLIRAKVGDQIWALQHGLVEGGTDPETGNAVNLGFGFNPHSVSVDAANVGTVTTTTSATALATSTVTYNVPNSPATWDGYAWVIYGNGFVASAPTYSAGVLTITVASNAASQALTILIWND